MEGVVFEKPLQYQLNNSFKTGQKNTITDVSGLLVGNSHSKTLKSGVSVLYGVDPFLASVHVMGGAPGTRETDLLAPDKMVQMIDAIVLAGGSAFGLDAASGVSNELLKKRRGFPTSSLPVPIVPSAILYDLNNGGNKSWNKNPYNQLGIKAFHNVSSNFELGSVGAGIGATTANLKGGLGSASVILEKGFTVGALIAVSAAGSAVMGKSKHFWAAPFEMDGEYGNLGMLTTYDTKETGFPDKQPFKGESTTIGIVATDAKLDKAQAKRVAIAAHDGMARSLFPSHTPFDGDLLFSLSTRKIKLRDEHIDTMEIGHAAAQCVARSVARAIYHASPDESDCLPVWRNLENEN